MRGPIRSVLLAALAVGAFAALAVGQASAAILGQPANTPFEAIYGNPPAAGPVGGGLADNFGFGENMLFEANSTAPSEHIQITLPGPLVSSATDSFIGGTLMSNKTGIGSPVGFTVQFADFQNNSVNGTTEIKTAAYADNSDRPWLTNICPLKEAGTECRIDANLTEAAAEGRTVKIEDVSVNIGPTGGVASATVQGTVWGKWQDGNATTPPCIKLEMPPTAAAKQTLVVTKFGAGTGQALGNAITAIAGKPCLISANNDWNTASKTAITIKNTG